MFTVFRDSQVVIHIDYLKKGKTVKGLYYAELLSWFDAELQKKEPHEEFIVATEAYFEDPQKTYFSNRLKTLLS